LPFSKKVINNRRFCTQSLYLSAFAPSFPAFFPTPLQTVVSADLAGRKNNPKNPEKKQKKASKKSKTKRQKEQQKTDKTSEKAADTIIATKQLKKRQKSTTKPLKTKRKSPLQMPAGGLAQVGGKVKLASAVQLSPHLRQAAPRQSNRQKTVKNQSINL
jgi:flagellar biosynthesis component FlhA